MNCDRDQFLIHISPLARRFIINVPETARQNLIRVCFQIELAYWYYLDFYVSGDNKLKGCSFTEFAAHVFQHLPFLQPHYPRLQEILNEWREYKQSVPTYGAAILSENNTHVLLVQSYWAKSSWGFPKGKVNEDEDPAHCAIREVYEETGFDLTNYIDPEFYLEANINDQHVRLYVIQGVSRETVFQPRTRNEIKACEWFAISDLPNSKKDSTPKVKMGVNANAFFMVLPFVKRLKALCNNGKGKVRTRTKSCSSFGEGEGVSNGKGKEGVKAKGKEVAGSKGKEYLRQRSEPGDVKIDKHLHTKRQLFNDEDEIVFSAPSWLNFKFDMAAIMQCI